jgi:pyruvate kinase
MTETGATPMMMSRIKSPLPIFAFSRLPTTQHKMCLYKGVHSIPFDSHDFPHSDVNTRAMEELRSRGVVDEGDLVIITKVTM